MGARADVIAKEDGLSGCGGSADNIGAKGSLMGTGAYNRFDAILPGNVGGKFFRSGASPVENGNFSYIPDLIASR